jgi:hypothetical protein
MPTGTESDPVEVRVSIVDVGGDITEEGVPVIDAVHNRVHSGQVFNASHRFDSVGNDASVSVLIRTGGKDVHFSLVAQAGGDAFITIYEGATPTANGTSIPTYNNFRRSPNVCATTFFHTPTVGGGSEGTAIFNGFTPGGSGPKAGGGEARSAAEWILKPATVYYIVITNKSGNTKSYSVAMEFYEEDEPI